MARTAVLLLSALVLSSCCCFGVDLPDPDANPPPGDAAPIAAARAYAQANAGALTSVLDGGGGGGGGGCASGIASLALDVAVAVATRGHAGGSTAAQVSIDPAACVARIVVLVVWAAHAWTAIGAQALDAAGDVIGEIGAPLATFAASPDPSRSGDVDLDVDELFD